MRTVFSLFFLAPLAMAENPQAFPQANIVYNGTHHIIGGQKMKLGVSAARSCEHEDLDAAAHSVKGNRTTDKWDANWYVFALPMHSCLVMAFIGNGVGWAAVTRQNDGFYIRPATDRNWSKLNRQGGFGYKFGTDSLNLRFHDPVAPYQDHAIFLNFGR